MEARYETSWSGLVSCENSCAYVDTVATAKVESINLCSGVLSKLSPSAVTFGLAEGLIKVGDDLRCVEYCCCTMRMHDSLTRGGAR